MKWLDSPEHMLVELLGVRLNRPQPAIVENWRAVIALARQSRTVALLHQVVKDRIDLSDDLRRELLGLGQRSFVETTAAAQALSAVAKALESVHWLVLRGPALGARLYTDLALRPFGDLDVLVAEHDVESTLKALQQIGYTFPVGALAEDYYRRYHLHFELVRPGPPVTSRLELHWASLPTLLSRGSCQRRPCCIRSDAASQPMARRCQAAAPCCRGTPWRSP